MKPCRGGFLLSLIKNIPIVCGVLKISYDISSMRLFLSKYKIIFAVLFSFGIFGFGSFCSADTYTNILENSELEILENNWAIGWSTSTMETTSTIELQNNEYYSYSHAFSCESTAENEGMCFFSHWVTTTPNTNYYVEFAANGGDYYSTFLSVVTDCSLENWNETCYGWNYVSSTWQNFSFENFNLFAMPAILTAHGWRKNSNTSYLLNSGEHTNLNIIFGITAENNEPVQGYFDDLKFLEVLSTGTATTTQNIYYDFPYMTVILMVLVFVAIVDGVRRLFLIMRKK